jgi:phosphopantothenate synthetase
MKNESKKPLPNIIAKYDKKKGLKAFLDEIFKDYKEINF